MNSHFTERKSYSLAISTSLALAEAVAFLLTYTLQLYDHA